MGSCFAGLLMWVDLPRLRALVTSWWGNRNSSVTKPVSQCGPVLGLGLGGRRGIHAAGASEV